MKNAFACELSTPALQRRKSGLLARVRGRALSHKSLARGVRLELPGSTAALADTLELIRLESACCPFLRFQLRTGPRGSPVTLTVTGPAGTTAFLASLGWLSDSSLAPSIEEESQ